MAYRRRHSAKSSSTFVEDAPSSPCHDDGSSLAARAIRASSLHRDSSFSAAYGETVIPSPHRDSTNQEAPPLYEQQEQHQQQQASTTYEYTSMKNLNDSKSGFWGVLARKAKNIFEEEDGTRKAEMFGRGGPQKFGRESPQTSVASAGVQHSYQSTETSRRTENPAIQKGLGAIASSLNYIGGKLENALEEGLTIVESKAADIISDTRKLNIRRKASTSGTPGQTQPIYPEAKNLHMPAIYTPSTQTDYETQLKASRDVAMAMAAKAKLLLRELKTVKADLAFAKQRCTQLEEENRILRESNERGDSPEDDDLIRLQLETLLAEKARLAHENSIYARENRFLREIVEYHQLTMQDVVYLDEGIEEVKEVYPITIPFETQHAQVPSPTLDTSPAPPGSASSTPSPHAPPTPSLPPVASPPPAPVV
ncbi:hypothetical protein EJ110_NYTH34161 [Nymphaea thermarum]|nr:hypothetical protein EJ110_NYTH34161 [Nymphaea thermarum]